MILRFETLESRNLLSAESVLQYEVNEIDPSEISTLIQQLEVAAPHGTDAAVEPDPMATPTELLNYFKRSFVTTTGTPSDYVVAPGAAYEGVAAILINSGSSLCTGTLLPTGRHILTAAHCVTDSSGVFNVNNATAVFTLSGGNDLYSVTGVAIHSDWLGFDYVQEGGDIAVLQLAQIVSSDIPRHDIHRESTELSLAFEKVGFGLSGTGTTGSQIGTSGIKRAGYNSFDATAEELNGQTIILGGIPTTIPANYFSAGGFLLFDFDSGSSANDAIGDILSVYHAGLGADEVSTAPGDSGGPAFLNGRIAGVTSFGLTNGSTDVDSSTNSEMFHPL